MFTHCIILAGGSGTRLWPLSNARRPKQFLPAPGSAQTFFGAAASRAFSVLEDGGRLLVIAGAAMTENVLQSCASLPAEQRGRITLLVEPSARNTAPAIAYAAWYIKNCPPAAGSSSAAGSLPVSRWALVLSSDHIIETTAEFAACARRLGAALAASHEAGESALGVFGIAPSRPETGYGYIEAAGELNGVHRVLSFHEKPDARTAERYVSAGNYFWNSGMFAFGIDFILEQFCANAPALYNNFAPLQPPPARFSTSKNNISILNSWPELEKAYTASENISFDYAIAEKCPAALMAAASFTWTDIGSWDEYAASGAAAPADVFTVDSANNYCLSEIPVALCGVDDLIVVIKKGATGESPVAFIARKGHSQKVRALVEQLKAQGRSDLL